MAELEIIRQEIYCATCKQPFIPKGNRGKVCGPRCKNVSPIPVETRFWNKVEKTLSCWIWKGALFRNGYGCFRFPTLMENRTHRIAWTLKYGPIPDGLVVCHHCDNPPCVNPDHLFVGTMADNCLDRDRKGRGVLPYMIEPGLMAKVNGGRRG